MKLCSCLCAVALVCAWAVAPRAGGQRVTPAGEVVVVLNEQFLNSLLEAVAAQPEPPSFPLSRGGDDGKCAARVTLLPEAAGVRTAVRFEGGRITAPVAFRGSYPAPLFGCLNFEGWADTAFDLSFDESRQALDARLTVRELKLKNVPMSLVGTGLTGLVQDSIDARVNPVEILRAEQLGVPVMRGNNLRLRARDIRNEVVGKELRLHIMYEIVQAE
jgi:hypothetical protein